MLLDKVSQYLAQVRGLPLLLAIGMVILNFILQFINVPIISLIADANLFLHLAVVVGLLGVLLADALGAW